MRFVPDEYHDTLRAYYQSLEVARLNDVLVENGIQETELREKVLEAYFFASGDFLDNGWFEADGRRFAPGVYFEELTPQGEPSGKVYVPDPELGTLFHEFAHFMVYGLLHPEEDDEALFDIPTGVVGDIEGYYLEGYGQDVAQIVARMRHFMSDRDFNDWLGSLQFTSKEELKTAAERRLSELEKEARERGWEIPDE